MFKLTPEDVKRVAYTARLDVTDEEVHELQSEIERLLTYARKMNEVDTDDVEAMTHARLGDGNVLRQDRVRPSLSKEETLQNAPRVQDGYFRVPRIVEDESGGN